MFLGADAAGEGAGRVRFGFSGSSRCGTFGGGIGWGLRFAMGSEVDFERFLGFECVEADFAAVGELFTVVLFDEGDQRWQVELGQELGDADAVDLSVGDVVTSWLKQLLIYFDWLFIWMGIKRGDADHDVFSCPI